MHLVGEFIEVLRCFGARDDDPLVRAGITFLLAQQDEDGLWDNADSKDQYTVYHATMVGVQALWRTATGGTDRASRTWRR